MGSLTSSRMLGRNAALLLALVALVAMSTTRAEAKPRRLIAKCKTGVIKACFDLAVAYENGDLAKTDVVKARELYKMACDARHGEACANLAVLWQVGDGGPLNLVTALALHERACLLSSASSCRAAGKHYGKKSGPTGSARAAFLRGAGCNMGSARACYDLGQPVQASHPALAKKLFGVACALGNDAVCTALNINGTAMRGTVPGHTVKGAWLPIDALGWLQTTKADKWSGVAAVEAKCNATPTDGKACWDAALGHWFGWGVTASVHKAGDLAAKACTANVPVGCLLAGWLASSKVHGTKEEGAKLWKQACAAKVTAACP